MGPLFKRNNSLRSLVKVLMNFAMMMTIDGESVLCGMNIEYDRKEFLVWEVREEAAWGKSLD